MSTGERASEVALRSHIFEEPGKVGEQLRMVVAVEEVGVALVFPVWLEEKFALMEGVKGTCDLGMSIDVDLVELPVGIVSVEGARQGVASTAGLPDA